MKKGLSILLILTLCIGLFAGCGNASGTKGGKVDAEAIEEVSTLLSALTADPEYQEASEDEKVVMVQEQLSELASQGKIKEDSIQVAEEAGTITYEFAGGGYGVVATKEFEQMTPEIYVA